MFCDDEIFLLATRIQSELLMSLCRFTYWKAKRKDERELTNRRLKQKLFKPSEIRKQNNNIEKSKKNTTETKYSNSNCGNNKISHQVA